MLPHPQRQGHAAAHNQPCIERTDSAAEVDLRLGADEFEIFPFADDGSAHGVAVTVDVFGKAFHRKIRAKLQGTLVEGEAKVLSTDRRAPFSCAISAMALMSEMASVGFPGVSIWMSLV